MCWRHNAIPKGVQANVSLGRDEEVAKDMSILMVDGRLVQTMGAHEGLSMRVGDNRKNALPQR